MCYHPQSVRADPVHMLSPENSSKISANNAIEISGKYTLILTNSPPQNHPLGAITASTVPAIKLVLNPHLINTQLRN